MVVERTQHTAKCWPEESAEELYAKLVAEHGEEIAATIWKMMQPGAETHRHRNPRPASGWYDNKGKQVARGFIVSNRGRVRHTRGGK